MNGLRIRVRGQVQGVGFRPFVWHLARDFGLRGSVWNDAEGVLAEVWGETSGFAEAIRTRAPPLARVDSIETSPLCGTPPEGFAIGPSQGQGSDTGVTPDAATCPDCLAEIRAPGRRQGYAFANCTRCGPRFTILNGLPYDRAQTTMAGFTLCPHCQAEYDNPADRRFHAQPIACPTCGPRLWYEKTADQRDGPAPWGEPPAGRGVSGSALGGNQDPEGERLTSDQRKQRGGECPDWAPVGGVLPDTEPSGRAPPDRETAGFDPQGAAMAQAVALLRRGGVLAVKGLGGFHLACDAANGPALARLRRRKHRPAKPFAVMATATELDRIAHLTQADRDLLADPAAPIVLVPSRGVLPEAVAPGLATLGVMVPATPLHHLLLDAFGAALVMTSGNLAGEPQAIGNDEARHKLAAFADGFLMHDRAIARRLDDGVERAVPRMVLRRARGRVPATLALPPGFDGARQVLALGGQRKGAICLVKAGRALLSHHLGDLDTALCLDGFHQAITDYGALFDHQPDLVAVDAHPGYRATQAGLALGLPVTEVWHHHAHLAACLAENLWPLQAGRVAGIVLDGAGLGPDGTIWGGELLLGDYAGFERRAHLAAVALPGRDRAATEPGRNLLAHLDRAGLSGLADQLLPDAPRDLLRRAIAGTRHAPLASSAGRLFDAVAAALGFAGVQSYEGQAAIWLQALAETAHADGPVLTFAPVGPVIDPRPMWHALAHGLNAGTPPALLAWQFHAGLAQSFAGRARALVQSGEAGAVALSGGCFQNDLLLRLTLQSLEGLPVLTHKFIPANDGGLALGQAVVALAQGMAGQGAVSPAP